MVRIAIEFELARGRTAVWQAFDDPANLKKWQPALVSFTPKSGTPGQPSDVSDLVYEENGRRVPLVETITDRREPEEFHGTCEAPIVHNSIRNRFEALGPDRTARHMEADFAFRGFLRLIGRFMRGSFQKRTLADMERFKALLEQEAV